MEGVKMRITTVGLEQSNGWTGRQLPPVSSKGPLALRLRALRVALGYHNASAFARTIGVKVTAWSNVENGHPISIALALQLIRRFPTVTLDYVYRGHSLPGELGQRTDEELTRLENQPVPSKLSGRPPKRTWARGQPAGR